MLHGEYVANPGIKPHLSDCKVGASSALIPASSQSLSWPIVLVITCSWPFLTLFPRILSKCVCLESNFFEDSLCPTDRTISCGVNALEQSLRVAMQGMPGLRTGPLCQDRAVVGDWTLTRPSHYGQKWPPWTHTCLSSI